MIGVTVAAFLMVGLVLDGGVMLRARSDAFSTAASAARVGAQQLDTDAAVEGVAVLDPVAAEQAALDYLAAHGVTGTVTVTADTVHGDRHHDRPTAAAATRRRRQRHVRRHRHRASRSRWTTP